MEYNIKVHPNSPENKIEEKQGYLEVYVKDKPRNNKANLSVIKLLSKHLGTDPKNIQLKGLNSRNKIAKIKTTFSASSIPG